MYLYHAYILGAKPAEPGLKNLEQNLPGPVFTRHGELHSTPKGDIKVSICTGEDIKCCVTHPDEVQLDE